MITKITDIEELKQVFIEALLNNTDAVTKVSDGSVLNGVGYGVSKLNQKILKDVAIIEAHQFPDTAVGSYLDDMARLKGIAPRFTAAKSSTYVRVMAVPGTVYTPGTHTFVGGGYNFDLLDEVTVPDVGFTYIKVNCQSTGLSTNVAPLSITRVNPVPDGHQYCINESVAINGRDFEDDDDFRKRIKDSPNILATKTLSFLEQLYRKFNQDVLRVMNLGLDNEGDLVLGICSVNGVDFTTSELADMLQKGEQYFSLNELKPNGLNSYGIKLRNVSYFPVDVSLRADLDGAFNFDIIRKEIQINMNKVVDYRYWEDGSVVDWIDLINAAKSVNGVKRVLDNYFFPNFQLEIPRGMLPRIRGFQLLNLQGDIIADIQGNLNPLYYPSNNDFAYQATVLKSL